MQLKSQNIRKTKLFRVTLKKNDIRRNTARKADEVNGKEIKVFNPALTRLFELRRSLTEGVLLFPIYEYVFR